MKPKERPILMSAPMVLALLSGAKTQTRRIVKLGTDKIGDEYTTELGDGTLVDTVTLCPYGQPGDRLWVKETFYDSSRESKRCPVTYRADSSVDEDLSRDFKWKPSIFIPRKLSRITLEITGVRVERLQDISDGDVAAEGCTWNEPLGMAAGEGNSPAQRAYCRLWESINGKKSWALNLWVWCISFKLLTPPPPPKDDRKYVVYAEHNKNSKYVGYCPVFDKQTTAPHGRFCTAYSAAAYPEPDFTIQQPQPPPVNR